MKIGKYNLDEKSPAFIMAEMSGNHGGDIVRAIEIIHAAKRAGADAVKLQTFTADTITLKSSKPDFQLPADSPWHKHANLWELYDEAHTPWHWHPKLFAEARSLGLEIFSSPFDESAVDFLETLNVSAYKIASPEITHIPLLRKVAQTGKPVVISNGVADLHDLNLAISTLRDSGTKDIIMLQCTSAYPSPPEEMNLNTIPDMARKFKVITGLSDHTVGISASVASVALGGRFIEKHFALDDGFKTVDSFFSSNESEFGDLVKEVRLLEASLGKVSYDISEASRSSISGRRSIYVSGDIKAGEEVTKLNICVVRPSFGMHPKYYDDVLGMVAKKDLTVGDRLTWDDIE